VPKTNAIREELRAFAGSIANGSTTAVTIEDGAAAMDIAHRVLEGMELQKA
jgi:predicted dehydrogenase